MVMSERTLDTGTGYGRPPSQHDARLTEDELHRFPGDNEAQGSQGPITQHSEEHLSGTDRGVVMLRSILRQIVDDVEAGREPMNASVTEVAIRTAESGVYTIATKALEPAGGE
jgi:hypothetical protein